MRAYLSFNRVGWLYKLDHRRLILIVFLSRLIFASFYDIFVSITDNDFLLPDSKFYSIRGRYIAALLNGYDKESFTNEMVPKDQISQHIFLSTIIGEKGRLPSYNNSSALFCYIIGLIYFIFGYFPLGVRVFNIVLSVSSAYFLFKIAKRFFGDLTANLFLLIALFLPSQFGYSITMSRDIIRPFMISLILFIIYG